MTMTTRTRSRPWVVPLPPHPRRRLLGTTSTIQRLVCNRRLWPLYLVLLVVVVPSYHSKTTRLMIRFHPPPTRTTTHQTYHPNDPSDLTGANQKGNGVDSSWLPNKNEETNPPSHAAVLGWIEDEPPEAPARRNHQDAAAPSPVWNHYYQLHQQRQHHHAVPPRAYPYSRFNNGQLPCFPPLDSVNWRRNRNAVVTQGLLFGKPTKVGGSTAAGVHLRMARNAADRQYMAAAANHNHNHTLNHTNNTTPIICRNSWDHAMARRRFAHRRRDKSLLWTLVRHPTSRLLSLFHHFYVSRGLCNATVECFVEQILHRYKPRHTNYYFQAVSMRPLLSRPQPGQPKEERRMNATDLLHGILDDYDFVGVTERFDESIVAVSLLWKVPLADVLYLSAKRGGSYDGGGGGCHLLPSTTMTTRSPEWQAVLQSPEFQAMTAWDAVVYDLANRSLDQTIDETIGRPYFESVLAQFRHALKVAQDECAATVVTPCSGGGLGIPHNGTQSRRRKPAPNRTKNNNQQQQRRPPPRQAPQQSQPPLTTFAQARPPRDTDCLVADSGCGYLCLDRVATQLHLWHPQAPLSYPFAPDAFSWGPSTRREWALVVLPQQENSKREPNNTRGRGHD